MPLETTLADKNRQIMETLKQLGFEVLNGGMYIHRAYRGKNLYLLRVQFETPRVKVDGFGAQKLDDLRGILKETGLREEFFVAVFGPHRLGPTRLRVDCWLKKNVVDAALAEQSAPPPVAS